MPELNLDEINKTIKDSAYAAIGFGVLGFQRAQVRRRELIEQLQAAPGKTAVTEQVDAARDQLTQLAKLVEEQIDPAREQVVAYIKQLDEQVAPAREQFDHTVDELESRLPASTRNTFAQLRKNARATEDRVRSVVGLDTPSSAVDSKSSGRQAS
jgi:small-conductance mechanosensitive channel